MIQLVCWGRKKASPDTDVSQTPQRTKTESKHSNYNSHKILQTNSSFFPLTGKPTLPATEILFYKLISKENKRKRLWFKINNMDKGHFILKV